MMLTVVGLAFAQDADPPPDCDGRATFVVPADGATDVYRDIRSRVSIGGECEGTEELADAAGNIVASGELMGFGAQWPVLEPLTTYTWTIRFTEFEPVSATFTTGSDLAPPPVTIAPEITSFEVISCFPEFEDFHIWELDLVIAAHPEGPVEGMDVSFGVPTGQGEGGGGYWSEQPLATEMEQFYAFEGSPRATPCVVAQVRAPDGEHGAEIEFCFDGPLPTDECTRAGGRGCTSTHRPSSVVGLLLVPLLSAARRRAAP